MTKFHLMAISKYDAGKQAEADGDNKSAKRNYSKALEYEIMAIRKGIEGGVATQETIDTMRKYATMLARKADIKITRLELNGKLADNLLGEIQSA